MLVLQRARHDQLRRIIKSYCCGGLAVASQKTKKHAILWSVLFCILLLKFGLQNNMVERSGAVVSVLGS